jgi:hypothetical protein
MAGVCDLGPIQTLDELQNVSNYTYEQLFDYVQIFYYQRCAHIIMLKVVAVIFLMSGFGGFLLYILMFPCIQRVSAMKGTTAIYHKALIVFELVHMIILAQYGVVKLLPIASPTNWFATIWRSKFTDGFAIGGCGRASASILSGFLTVERFVAICLPAKYANINKKSVAYASILICALLGSVQIWGIATMNVRYDDKKGVYVSEPTWFGQNVYGLFLNFVSGMKIFLIFLIFPLSMATAMTLRRQAKSMHSMSSNAKKEWLAKKQICTFCYIQGVCTLIDHLAWVLSTATNDTAYSYISPDSLIIENEVAKSYMETMKKMRYYQTNIAMWFIQAITQGIVHGWRFLFYLLFFKSMRKALKEAMKCGQPNTVSSVDPKPMTTTQQ